MFILIGYQFCPREVKGNNLPFIANMAAWGFPSWLVLDAWSLKMFCIEYLFENLINIFFLQNKVVSGNGVCFELLTFYTR